MKPFVVGSNERTLSTDGVEVYVATTAEQAAEIALCKLGVKAKMAFGKLCPYLWVLCPNGDVVAVEMDPDEAWIDVGDDDSEERTSSTEHPTLKGEGGAIE